MKDDDSMNDELDELAENITLIMEGEDAKIYSEEVIAEFRNPSNIGRMAEADGQGVADGLCKDTMEICVKVRDGVITECTFFTDGCGATIACGSRLTRFVKGLRTDEAIQIRPRDLVSLLNGLPPDHEHCAALAIIALRNALRDCEARRSAGAREGETVKKLRRYRCTGCDLQMALPERPEKCFCCGSTNIVREGWRQRFKKISRNQQEREKE